LLLCWTTTVVTSGARGGDVRSPRLADLLRFRLALPQELPDRNAGTK
jgi:hypothetical protein